MVIASARNVRLVSGVRISPEAFIEGHTKRHDCSGSCSRPTSCNIQIIHHGRIFIVLYFFNNIYSYV